jgi:hypothetical protein
MKKDSRYIWYLFDILAFLVVVFGNIWLWSRMENPRDWMDALTPFKLLIFGLATYRLADIITTESVTDVIRAPFKDMRIENGVEKWKISNVGFRGFLGTLLSYPSCMGVWVAMFLFYFYVFYPNAASAFMIIMSLNCPGEICF